LLGGGAGKFLTKNNAGLASGQKAFQPTWRNKCQLAAICLLSSICWEKALRVVVKRILRKGNERLQRMSGEMRYSFFLESYAKITLRLRSSGNFFRQNLASGFIFWS
jgi:hypothetical protein